MRQSQLSQETRRLLVAELESWKKEGLITGGQFDALRKSYDFDFPQSPSMLPSEHPLPRSPENMVSTSTPAPISTPPPKIHHTLIQTLLSETSIRIALYLGAFFVISAGLILAALVAALRLPILLGVATLFGVGSILLKRRLPQPAFVLYIVFSALLPIMAGVLADIQDFPMRKANAYWMMIFLGMAVLWAFSTWLWRSRFFSLASFIAIDVTMIFASILILDVLPELYLFLLTISSLIGLGGSWLLRRWIGSRFALPLFIIIQVQQGIIFLVAVFFLLRTSFYLQNVHILSEQTIYPLGTWLLTGLFIVLCFLYFPNRIYPWLAAFAFMPVTWLAVLRFLPVKFQGTNAWYETYHLHYDRLIAAIAIFSWGLIYAVLGEFARRDKGVFFKYSTPLTLASLPLLFLGSWNGQTWDKSPWLGIGLYLSTAMILTLLHVFHSRSWLWVLAVGAYVMTCINFFWLAFINVNHISVLYVFMVFLLVLGDMLIPGNKPLPAWRWPLRGWAIIIGIIAFFTCLLSYSHNDNSASEITILLLVFLGSIYLAYAIRMKKPWIGIFSNVHLILALAYFCDYYPIHSWLPIMAGLAVFFYALGRFLSWRKFLAWGTFYIWSGLVLAAILSLVAFLYKGEGRTWTIAILAMLFVIETFRLPIIEILTPIFFSLVVIFALSDADIGSAIYYLAGIALVSWVLDLVFTRVQERTKLRWVIRLVGCVSSALIPILAFVPHYLPGVGAICCACLVVLFFLQWLVYRYSISGYLATASLVLAVLFSSLYFFDDHWLWALIVTALVLYVLSLIPGKLQHLGWGRILRLCCISLATLVAISAPFENSGMLASLPVAIAASMWAFEAFRFRSVWFGFPANIIYLMAYFMILFTLKVDQPQFYSVGAAVLGLLMHYLLIRSGSRIGAFLTGMFSQLVLLSTTYFQMVGSERVMYFAVLFFQSLVVLIYGIVIRSRSLVITPIIMVVIGVVTVVFSILRDFSTVILVGCTGIGLIFLGIAALLMRERFTTLRDRLRDWRA